MNYLYEYFNIESDMKIKNNQGPCVMEFFSKATKTNKDFCEELTKTVMTELILTSIDGVVTTVNALILYLSLNPEIQLKVYNELKELNISEIDLITLNYKKKVPFTSACILETLRIVSQAPLGVFRKTNSDVELFDYKIPRGTILVPNLWRIHHDSRVYGEPFQFRPERFITSTGELLDSSNEMMKNLTPFGYGYFFI